MLEFKSRANTQCFAKVYKQQILVDPNTRKPTELPLFWREKYGGMPTGSPVITERLTRPQRCILSSLYTIQDSDIDHQNHTNYLSFVKLFMEATKKAAINGCFETFSAETLKNGLQAIQIRYANEVLVDQVVAVHVWEAVGRNDRLCFEITRGLDVCNQAVMTFYQTLRYSCKSESQNAKL
jgi:acyl-CoA thioesterase FadM